jgi:hypothetical protein
MSHVIDLMGQTFGRLTVVQRGTNRGKCPYWICRCVCGTVVTVLGADLRRGNTQSCGCYRAELKGRNWRTHGLSHHPLHRVWHNIVKRCFDPRSISYRNYGARGITMKPPEWQDDVVRFIREVEAAHGPMPKGMSIDRVDVNGHYEITNLRYASRAQQNLNTRKSRYWTLDGERTRLVDIAQRLAIPLETLRNRLSRAERALGLR